MDEKMRGDGDGGKKNSSISSSPHLLISSSPHLLISSSLFRSPCRFVAGAASIESLPPVSLPEIAFIGRSNVGKSSLINALVGQTALVKTSKNPGHTKQLNFFLLGNCHPRAGGDPFLDCGSGDKKTYIGADAPSMDSRLRGNDRQGSNSLMLVDMPGYGFARVSKQQKGEWDHLIRSYLCGRPTLKRACLLIDARRGVMKPDKEFMDLLDEAAVSFQIVLTKIDAVKPAALTMLLTSLKKTIGSHPAAHPEAIATSAAGKEGIDALQAQLTPFAQQAQ